MSSKNYAFIKNGIVINVAVFEDPSEDTLEFFKVEHDADLVIDASESTSCEVGGEYDGAIFWRIKPYDSWIKSDGIWTAPMPYPTDGKKYIWNESVLDWQEDSSI